MGIKFGPAGLGPVKTAVETLERYHELGFRACEIAFTRGPYIKDEKDMRVIREAAERLGIQLTIHAPYYVNLNSDDPEKVEMSKKRILSCCKIGEKLGVRYVVFHPGYYGKMNPETTYNNIRDAIIDMQDEIKKNKWKVQIAAETMGKVNVFGSIDQIANLVKDTGCSFCIDYAHILARDKKVDYKRVEELFPQGSWHVHFSGIVYNEKGERHHKTTLRGEWEVLIKNLPKDKEISIVNESPTMVEDSLEGLEVYGER
ncbi:endonuclease IV [Candidatus Pacearchaeota archaeon]|nr:endonuclease IV [Candidatus Pacearchaeota archaeon]